ncbi:MAG: MBL fold metallo-hydrolase [bacterium]|nr:MBL fold metallo-hydrolase [bacterium]
MRITKYGHSCLYIEEGGARILIDPGSYCFQDLPLKPEDIPVCDVILLTHEHADHTYPEALKIIIAKSKPLIVTNAGVQKFLQTQGIASEVLGRGAERKIKGTSVDGVAMRGIACDHGIIADFFPKVENIGFLIAGRLFHPGDCVAPSEEVHAEILAVPAAAPWMALREGVDFMKRVKPKVALPIHDAFLKHPEMPWYKVFEMGTKDTGITFTRMPIGEAKEF